MRRSRRAKRGFTLLEVIIAGGLFAFVTAAALASYVAQVQLTNTQQQSSTATDETRDAMRMIGDDIRAAAPGINASLISGGPAGQVCPPGTIPYAGGAPMAPAFSSPSGPACLPVVFRSTSPLAPFGALGTGACGGVAPTNPGYQLQVSPTQFEPAPASGPSTAYFCPDDLVILAVDDSDAFFMSAIPGSIFPTSSLPVTTVNFLFMPPPAAAIPNPPTATSFDLSGVTALISNPMLLISGASGPVLINTGTPVVNPLYTGSTDPAPPSDFYQVAQVPLGGTQFDMFGTLGSGTPVAMPARLVQYSIEPVNASGGTTAPFVSANLVRTELTPTGAAPWFVANPVGTVLVKGVIDMQVEFGLDPLGTGQLRYVNSGGYQLTQSLPPPAAPPGVDTQHVSTTCSTVGASASGLFGGTCFPSNDMNLIRSVRLNLLVRSGTITNSRTVTGQAMTNAAGVAPPFYLQPAVQDITGGNLEAQNWGWPFATPPGFPTVDGAEYREVSTEIFIRNLGLTNNF